MYKTLYQCVNFVCFILWITQRLLFLVENMHEITWQVTPTNVLPIGVRTTLCVDFFCRHFNVISRGCHTFVNADSHCQIKKSYTRLPWAGFISYGWPYLALKATTRPRQKKPLIVFKFANTVICKRTIQSNTTIHHEKKGTFIWLCSCFFLYFSFPSRLGMGRKGVWNHDFF